MIAKIKKIIIKCDLCKMIEIKNNSAVKINKNKTEKKIFIETIIQLMR